MLYLRVPLSRVWIAILCELGILIQRTKIDRSFFHCKHMLIHDLFFFLFHCFQFLLSYRISCWGIRFLNVSQHEFIKNWLIIVFLNFTKKGSISETLESWIVVISSDPAGLKEIKPAVKAMYARKVMFETEESLETKSTCNSVQVKLTIQWTLSLNNKVRIEIKV